MLTNLIADQNSQVLTKVLQLLACSVIICLLKGEAMQVYTVEYTGEHLIGNQVHTLELEAESLEAAWLILDINYPHLSVDCVYPKELAYM